MLRRAYGVELFRSRSTVPSIAGHAGGGTFSGPSTAGSQHNLAHAGDAHRWTWSMRRNTRRSSGLSGSSTLPATPDEAAAAIADAPFADRIDGAFVPWTAILDLVEAGTPDATPPQVPMQQPELRLHSGSPIRPARSSTASLRPGPVREQLANQQPCARGGGGNHYGLEHREHHTASANQTATQPQDQE